MKESEFVKRNVTLVTSALPAEVQIRTTGGSQEAKEPFCILDRELTDVKDHGANPRAGIIRDDRGYAIGEELHRTSQAELTWHIRSYDETQRDELVNKIKGLYTLCEEDSSYFDVDTYLWSVGRSTPAGNAVVEPDWYESEVKIFCHLLTRVTKDGDPIEKIKEEYKYGSEY